jgi:arylsulfatase A-like enzyme
LLFEFIALFLITIAELLRAFDMRSNQVLFLLSIILLICFGCQRAKKQPNFLLIVADDLGYTDVAAFGSSFYDTPNLDALTESGIRFTDGYASCPVCSPTRASIQTGRYPVRSGITDWIPGRAKYVGTTSSDRWLNLPTVNELKLEEKTIAEVLSAHNYRTFFAGKWHLGEEEEYWPENQGYQINKGGYRRGAPNRNKKSGTRGYFTPYGNPRLSDGPEGEYLPERLASETIQFIRNQNDREPFFACLSFYLVHTPLQAKEADVEAYHQKRKLSDIDMVRELDAEPDWAEWATRSHYTERHRQGLPVYAAMVRSLDNNIGKVLQALKDQKLYDNTVVIFTSDNGGLSTAEGWPTSNAPLRAGKGWLYEGGIRVPWIVKLQNNELSGSTTQMPVCSIDIMPTILALAGISVDWQIDGIDVLRELDAEDTLARPLFWHYPHYSNQGGNPGSVIRLGRYKLIHDFETGTKLLFDLKSDIGETNDLSAGLPLLTDSLYHLLDEWRTETRALMMTKANPEWDEREPVKE